jgi:hypothetical protein
MKIGVDVNTALQHSGANMLAIQRDNWHENADSMCGEVLHSVWLFLVLTGRNPFM